MMQQISISTFPKSHYFAHFFRLENAKSPEPF
jgi:hypothetical protein